MQKILLVLVGLAFFVGCSSNYVKFENPSVIQSKKIALIMDIKAQPEGSVYVQNNKRYMVQINAINKNTFDQTIEKHFQSGLKQSLQNYYVSQLKNAGIEINNDSIYAINTVKKTGTKIWAEAEEYDFSSLKEKKYDYVIVLLMWNHLVIGKENQIYSMETEYDSAMIDLNAQKTVWKFKPHQDNMAYCKVLDFRKNDKEPLTKEEVLFSENAIFQDALKALAKYYFPANAEFLKTGKEFKDIAGRRVLVSEFTAKYKLEN